MLSKFIYKALMVFALAVFAQVGYSQSYVSSDEAQLILKEEIAELESSVTGAPANTSMTTSVILNSSKVQLEAMQYVLKSIAEDGKTVSEVMTSSLQRVNNLAPTSGKEERLNDLNAIKDLLS